MLDLEIINFKYINNDEMYNPAIIAMSSPKMKHQVFKDNFNATLVLQLHDYKSGKFKIQNFIDYFYRNRDNNLKTLLIDSPTFYDFEYHCSHKLEDSDLKKAIKKMTLKDRERYVHIDSCLDLVSIKKSDIAVLAKCAINFTTNNIQDLFSITQEQLNLDIRKFIDDKNFV